jgi:hypothetical protein
LLTVAYEPVAVAELIKVNEEVESLELPENVRTRLLPELEIFENAGALDVEPPPWPSIRKY